MIVKAHYPSARSLTTMVKTSIAMVVIASSSAAFATVATTDAKPVSPQVSQLTALVTQIMPLGDIFAALKQQMPLWPFQDHPNAVSPDQLSCVRQELSTENYMLQNQEEVQNYVDNHPDKVAADIQLLTNASPLWSSAMKAGIAQKTKDSPVDAKKMIGDSTPEQLLAVMNLIQNPKNEDLRKLIGLQGLQIGEQPSNGSVVGKNAVLTKMTPLLLKSMATCHVSMKSLF